MTFTWLAGSPSVYGTSASMEWSVATFLRALTQARRSAHVLRNKPKDGGKSEMPDSQRHPVVRKHRRAEELKRWGGSLLQWLNPRSSSLAVLYLRTFYWLAESQIKSRPRTTHNPTLSYPLRADASHLWQESPWRETRGRVGFCCHTKAKKLNYSSFRYFSFLAIIFSTKPYSTMHNLNLIWSPRKK